MTDGVASAGQDWSDHFWWSGDGVRLHARLYGALDDTAAIPVICMPGLTRNARDFDTIAPKLAQFGPVAAVSFRGRGDSGYAKDPMTYVPLTYAQDILAMLDSLNWDRFALIGTSLGGLVAMLLAATLNGRVRGVVLNDVGPELEAKGLERIRTYVGVGTSQPTWLHAARQAADSFSAIYPDYAIQDWLRMVHRTHRLTPEGRIIADYDKQVGAPLRAPGGEAGIDLWPAFDAMAALPLLIIRGEASDILAKKAAAKMLKRAGSAELCVVPRVGHAPTLDESEACTAIMAWRARLS